MKDDERRKIEMIIEAVRRAQLRRARRPHSGPTAEIIPFPPLVFVSHWRAERGQRFKLAPCQAAEVVPLKRRK
jgi:hypothetical protein